MATKGHSTTFVECRVEPGTFSIVMINIEAISKEARKIKNKYNETDPIKLCREMKIKLIF
jgi:hypothetical protein